MRGRRLILALTCLAGLTGVGLLAGARAADNACLPFSGSCQRVLFLGNSYTYVNDLPAVFRHLARVGGRDVVTGMVAHGGETLAGHLAATESVQALKGQWAFVVLQEQSEIPAVARVRQTAMYPATRSLVSLARAAGASPVLLETWAHLDGWPDYGLDYQAMQTGIDAGYADIGHQLGVRVAAAGEAWLRARRELPSVDLWQADGSHPTLAGTYLTACILYAALFHANPSGLPNTEALPDQVVRDLQAAAFETVGTASRSVRP